MSAKTEKMKRWRPPEHTTIFRAQKGDAAAYLKILHHHLQSSTRLNTQLWELFLFHANCRMGNIHKSRTRI